MYLSKAFTKRPLNESRDAHRPLALPRFRLVYTVLVLAGYGLALQTLGYLTTTFLALFGLFFDRGTNRFLPSVLASLLTVVLTYLIFGIWLRVQLPRGIFPWW
jgi:Na+/proline symporter